MPSFDPAASLRLWTVDVVLLDRRYEIPAKPAGEWILALLEDGWPGIVPGMLTGAGDEIDEALMDGTLTYLELARTAREAFEQVAGTRWWTAERLVKAAVTEPSVQGALKVDVLTAPLGQVVMAYYEAYTRHAKPTSKARLDMELDRAPEGLPVHEWFDEDAAADAFEQQFQRRAG